METILEGKGIAKHFGGLKVIIDIDFQVKKGEIFSLIGPNGAGKTTLLNLINGLLPLTAGEFIFKGKKISGIPPYQIALLGIARAFQVVQPLEGMSVRENVAVGALFGKKSHNLTMAAALREADKVLECVELSEKRNYKPSEITLSQRKRLELARALAMEPELLLLDEVMAGLNPTESNDFLEILKKINKDGITILFIEHIMKAVMSISDRIMVLHDGKKLATGTPAEITNNNEVIQAYLGRESR